MSEEVMEHHIDSDKDAEGSASDADGNSEEELKRIEEELYFAIHFGEAEETNGEESVNVTVYHDSPVKLWNETPPSKLCSTPKAGAASLETSDIKQKAPQVNDPSSKTKEPLDSLKRKKQLKSAASPYASPHTHASSVLSTSDSRPDNCVSKLQPEQGKDLEQRTQSAFAPTPNERSRLVGGQPETGDHVNVANPGMSIGALLQALQVSKHGAWSDESDSSLDSGPVPGNSRLRTQTAGMDGTPSKTAAKNSSVSNSTEKSKIPTAAKICDSFKSATDASVSGNKAKSVTSAQSSLPCTKESTKGDDDDDDRADADGDDNDQLGTGLSEVKVVGKNAKRKKISKVKTTPEDEISGSHRLPKGKSRLSPTVNRPLASRSKELLGQKVGLVAQSSGSSSSSGEKSDSESSSSDESDTRQKKKHKTKKVLKQSVLSMKTKQKPVTAGRASETRKQMPKSKGSDVMESTLAESLVKVGSSSSDSDSESEMFRKTKIVSKVPKNVISCKTDSESDNSSSKKKMPKKAPKKVQSAFSITPKAKRQTKQSLESRHPDVAVTMGSDSSMEESNTTSSLEESDASSESLDVNDSDFLNQLSDGSLKEDIMFNMTEEDNSFVKKSNNSQTTLSTPEQRKWHLNARDQASSSGVRNSGSRSMRYFLPSRCDNCQEAGHLARDCPEPRKQICHLCARVGHIGQRCPERQCFNCSWPGHDARDCPKPRRSRHMICHRCQMGGHKQEDCPDQWRQFHATTSGVVPVRGKEKERKDVSCYNCGALRHLGYECTESRMNGFVMPSYPYVAWYDSAETMQRTMKAARQSEGKEEDNPWRQRSVQDSADSKRKYEEEPERNSKKTKFSRDFSPQTSSRNDWRKEKTSESGTSTRTDRDYKKEAESRKTIEAGRDSKQGDSSLRDATAAREKKQNEDATLTSQSKRSSFSGPLEDFISLSGEKKGDRKPAKQDSAGRSRFDAAPHTEKEAVPIFATVRDALKQNKKMLREVTGDITTHHLTPRQGQRVQGVMGGRWHDSWSEQQQPPPKLSRKRRREQGSQDYGHHSSQWGEVDDNFHLVGADINQLVRDTQHSNSVHGSPWDMLQDDKPRRDFGNAQRSNSRHGNIWDLPSSSKQGKYDFPRTPHSSRQMDQDSEPAPKLNRKAQLRAAERASKESKKAQKEQQKLKKKQKQQAQEHQLRDLEEEFGDEYNHQVFNNEWWLQDSASPPSIQSSGTWNKKKTKKKKKKKQYGNYQDQDSFEDDDEEKPFLTGITQRQRKKWRKKSSSSLQDTRRKNPNLGAGPQTFRIDSPGPSQSRRNDFQEPNPQHHGQNQDHHGQKQGRHVSWNPRKRSPGFKRERGGSAHYSHRGNTSFSSPEHFHRGHSKKAKATPRGRGQGRGNRGFVSRGGFRVEKDVLDRASNLFQSRGRRRNR